MKIINILENLLETDANLDYSIQSAQGGDYTRENPYSDPKKKW